MLPLTRSRSTPPCSAGRIHAPDRFDVAVDRAVGEPERHDRTELGNVAQPVAPRRSRSLAKPSDFTT